MSDTKASDLARELGAIASGEAWRNSRDWNDEVQTGRFATGLTRLINESIAAALGGTAAPVKDSGNVDPWRVTDVVAVGDRFLCLTDCQDFKAGRVSVVIAHDEASDSRHPFLLSNGIVADEARASASWLLESGDWQRVPTGYTLPSAMEFHAATRRLVDAYRAMLRDPETGAAGVDATVRQMAGMAGMDVPA
jgi:hypothetical protein